MKFFINTCLTIFIFITFCSPGRPLVQFSDSFPGKNVTRVHSLTGPLQEGVVCSFTGIYDLQPAGPSFLPVLRVFDPDNGTGFAYLSDTLAVPYGTCLKINGLVIKDFLSLKPAKKIPVKKINVTDKTVLTETEVFKTKANRLYEKNLDRMQQYNEDNKIDLNLPLKVNWKMLYDESKNNIIAYTVTGNGIYESRVECVFGKDSRKVKSIYFNSYIKGE